MARHDRFATKRLESIWENFDEENDLDLCDRVRNLLRQRADPDAENGEGLTGLHLACIHGRKDLWNLLKTRGADVHKGSKEGNTALHFAAAYMSSDLDGFFSDVLGMFKNPDVRRGDGATPLHSLCAFNEEPNEILTILLGRGANPCKKRYEDGATPLHIAAKDNRSDVVAKFLNKRCSLNIKDDNGYTPLHTAIIHESSDACRHLLYKGAGVKFSDDQIGLVILGLRSDSEKVRNVFYVWLRADDGGYEHFDDVSKRGTFHWTDDKVYYTLNKRL